MNIDKTPESTDASALVKSLQDQLKKRPAASIEDAANKQTGTTNNRDPLVQSAAPDVPLGGETKPEHATPEALINPFSLVNIQRGAAMGAVMTKGYNNQSKRNFIAPAVVSIRSKDQRFPIKRNFFSPGFPAGGSCVIIAVPTCSPSLSCSSS